MEKRKPKAPNRYFLRWATDVREMTSGIFSDPLVSEPKGLWQFDFAGEIGPADVRYSVFLVVLSLLPAIVGGFWGAYVSFEPQFKIMGRLFGAPLQAVITGFLTASLVFMGSHLNHVPRPFPQAYKLMLRIMSVYPMLGFLSLSAWGSVASVLLYGFFVIRGVRRTYPIPLFNAVLFFGMVYLGFAVFQLQSVLMPQQIVSPAVTGFSMMVF